MGIEEILEDIRKVSGLSKGILYGINNSVEYNEISKICTRILGHRLSGANGNFHIKFGNLNQNHLFGFSLSEFPSCCGKGILHGIVISKTVRLETCMTTLSNEDYDKLVNLVFNLAEQIFIVGQYSSFDFIISDNDNTNIYESMKRSGVKPVTSWRNSRYPQGHNCNNYTFNMVKTVDVDYLDKSRIVQSEMVV